MAMSWLSGLGRWCLPDQLDRRKVKMKNVALGQLTGFRTLIFLGNDREKETAQKAPRATASL